MSNARILGNIVVGGTFDTDKLSEGSTNLFYTNARVDAEIDSYLSAGTGITLAGSGSIAVDTSVIATKTYVDDQIPGAAQTENHAEADGSNAGLASFRSSQFSVNNGYVQLNSSGVILRAQGTTNEIDVSVVEGTATISLPNDVTISGTMTANAFSGDGSGLTGVTSYVKANFDSDFGSKTTDNLTEGSTNLYYDSATTQTNARNAISVTGDLSYVSSTGVLSFSETYSTASELLTAIKTVDGAASGLDADTLDGQQGVYYRINVYNNSGTLLN